MVKQLCTKNCLSSLGASEMLVSGVSSMYIYIMHYLNFFLSCSIKNLTLASVGRLFTIKNGVDFSFTHFDSCIGLFSLKAIDLSGIPFRK